MYQSCTPGLPPRGATSGGRWGRRRDTQSAVPLGERRGAATDAAIARTTGGGLLVGSHEGVHEPGGGGGGGGGGCGGGGGGGHVHGRVRVEVHWRAHYCCVDGVCVERKWTVERTVWSGLCGADCVERTVWSGLCGADCVERTVWSGLCGADCVERTVWSGLQWSVEGCVRRTWHCFYSWPPSSRSLPNPPGCVSRQTPPRFVCGRMGLAFYVWVGWGLHAESHPPYRGLAVVVIAKAFAAKQESDNGRRRSHSDGFSPP